MIARLQAWAVAAASAVVAVLAAFGIGRVLGGRRAKQEAAERIEQEQRRVAAAERDVADNRIRTEIENDVLRLPSGTGSALADAAPGTAAEQLRDDWSRD
ncbi:hypothetical protein [Lysobacter enzymogenes]|uniref:hypothetical protein n=1 Tax=Lysobacter enzymogenes TaxID=69 RepID=UPI001AFA9A6F|nr:hypothetical protein [Lysobacter enzymogenes]QQQ00890.1 hypothetical protein JHW41_22960 [Lysobacter enzymogenes]